MDCKWIEHDCWTKLWLEWTINMNQTNLDGQWWEWPNILGRTKTDYDLTINSWTNHQWHEMDLDNTDQVKPIKAWTRHLKWPDEMSWNRSKNGGCGTKDLSYDLWAQVQVNGTKTKSTTWMISEVKHTTYTTRVKRSTSEDEATLAFRCLTTCHNEISWVQD